MYYCYIKLTIDTHEAIVTPVLNSLTFLEIPSTNSTSAISWSTFAMTSSFFQLSAAWLKSLLWRADVKIDKSENALLDFKRAPAYLQLRHSVCLNFPPMRSALASVTPKDGSHSFRFSPDAYSCLPLFYGKLLL